jgi:hypothetical protein
MAEAVAEYARHRDAPDEWALGRFVVPFARWRQFAEAVAALAPVGLPWPVSLLASPSEVGPVAATVTERSSFIVQSVESRADSVTDVDALSGLVDAGLEVFVEPSSVASFDAIASSIARIGAAGKIRTGGVTAAAFPDARQVLAFLQACRRHGIRFKATAGLHHAIRGEYRLTYEPSPPMGLMFGFLNIAMGSALLWFGRGDDVVLDTLEERSSDAFEFTEAGVTWQQEHLTAEQLDDVRSEFFVGFGSCSFREPMADLGLEAVPRA